MYDNIGGKIKSLAKTLSILGAIATAILAIVLLCLDDKLLPFGVILLFFGPLFSWISSWLLYGFGELVENACTIEREAYSKEKNHKVSMSVNSERINEIQKLRAQGLLTEEEYQQAIAKER
ncbi:MAG: hypothetical protein IJX82_00970 [Clostridia bacterium]|nr:hypothetical protein [Clostridia bacterium]